MENPKFKASLDSIMRSCQKKTTSKRIGASVTGAGPSVVAVIVTKEVAVVPAGMSTKEAGVKGC